MVCRDERLNRTMPKRSPARMEAPAHGWDTPCEKSCFMVGTKRELKWEIDLGPKPKWSGHENFPLGARASLDAHQYPSPLFRGYHATEGSPAF